jgi:hypothetical protein
MGFPIYGSTPEQRKEKRAERTKAKKEKMAEYKQRMKDRGLEP